MDALGRGLLISMGVIWNWLAIEFEDQKLLEIIPLDLIERNLFHDDPNIRSIATWTWTNARKRLPVKKTVSVEILNSFFHQWVGGGIDRGIDLAGYAMACQIGIDRDAWTPILTKSQIQKNPQAI